MNDDTKRLQQEVNDPQTQIDILQDAGIDPDTVPAVDVTIGEPIPRGKSLPIRKATPEEVAAIIEELG